MSDEELSGQADEGEPEKGRWSQTEQLLAVVADRVADLAYLYASANTASKSKKPKAPEPIKRPGARARKSKPKLSDEQASTIFRLINGGAA